MKRYKVWESTLHGTRIDEKPDGEWVQWDDVSNLEESHAKMVELLKEARYVCAYTDKNTDLLDEIDTHLNKLGETDLPELN